MHACTHTRTHTRTNPRPFNVASLAYPNGQAAFVRIATTQAEDIKPLRHYFEQTTERLCKKLGEEFRTPLLVLSVTGGAQALQLPPHMCAVIEAGLRRIIAGSSAIVVTGGSTTGVMKVRFCQ